MANNIQNLKPCKPGETHNPNGRPKGTKSFKVVLAKVLDGIVSVTEAGEQLKMTKREVLAMELAFIALDKKAKKSDRLKAIDMILDRMEGKPKQTVEGDFDNHMVIEVIE